MATAAVARADTEPGEMKARIPVPHLRALTGLRFMAAALVVLFHYALYTAPATTFTAFGITVPHGAPHLIANGWLGVSFFFILSGFILAYNYLDERGEMRVHRRDFWIARFARVYPVYVLAFAVAALPFFWEKHHSLATVVATGAATLTLVQSWIPSLAVSWNGPGWSLSNELFFYALFPLIAIHVARLRQHGLYAVLIASWAASLAMTFALSHFSMQSASTSAARWAMVMGFNPLVRLPEFLAGVALGCLFIARRASGAGQVGRRRMSPALLSTLALVGITGIMSSDIVLPHGLPTYLIIDPLFALLIYSLAFGQGLIAQFFASRGMIVLGQASYAIYLLHSSLLDWAAHLSQHVDSVGRSSVMRSPGGFVAYVGIVIGLSIAILYLVEEPARRAITGSIRRPRAQTVIDSPVKPGALQFPVQDQGAYTEVLSPP